MQKLKPFIFVHSKTRNSLQDTKAKNKSRKPIKDLQTQQSDTTTIQVAKDDFLQRLEDDLKKLQQELQTQKSTETFLRSQVNYYTKCDRTDKLKIDKIQQDNEQLQVRIQKLQAQKEKEKDELVQTYEKRLQDEKRAKLSLEQQLQQQEKKSNEQVAANSNMLTMSSMKILKR